MPPIATERLASLVTGAAEVAATADLSHVLWATTETARDMTGARYAALGVIGEHGTLVEFLHLGLEPGEAEKIGPLPSGRGVLGTLIRSARTIRLERIQDHPDSVGFPPNHPPMESFLGVPVRVGDRVFGNLYLTEKPGGFDLEDERLVEALAAIAGSAVANARAQQRLRRMAVAGDRERIARDLHDAIIQDLFAVGLGLQGLANRVDHPQDRKELEDAVERLDEAITSLREFIFGLRRRADPGRNLAVELNDLVRSLADPHQVEVEVLVEDGLAENGEITGPVIDDVCRIVGEATSNALRHSGTDSIEVEVRQGSGCVVVRVTDHGSGFDRGHVEQGMGITNMEQRAAEAGGELIVVSQPGIGTTVRAVIPV